MSRLARLPWQRIAMVSLVLTTLLFGVRVVQMADGDWGRLVVSMGHHVWLVGWVLLVSVIARSRTVLHTVGAFYGGFFTAMWLAIVLGDRSGAWLGPSNAWHLALALPIIEEVAKLVPLLVVVLVWRRRRAGLPGIVDLGVLGLAAGAGFAVHEDALWARLSGSGFEGILGWVAPTFHTEAGLVMGHAGWTGLVGLGLGVWLATPRRRWTALVPLAAVAIVIADHGLWNHVVLRQEYRQFLVDGWLPVGLFLGGLLVALVVDTRVVQRQLGGQPASFVRQWPSTVLRGGGPVTRLRRARRWGMVLRGGALASHRLASLERGGAS